MELPTTKCKNCEKSFDATFDYCPYCGQEAADNLTIGVLFSNTISNYFSVDARFFRSFIPLLTKPGVLARRFVDGKRVTYLHPAQFYLFISVVFFFVFSFNVRRADNEVSQALKKGFGKENILDSLQLAKDSVALEMARDALKKNAVVTGISEQDLKAIDSVILAEQNNPDVSFSFKREALDSLIAINATKSEKLKAMGLQDDAGAFTRMFYEQMLKFYEQQGGGILKTLYDTIPIAMFFMLPLFALLLKLFYWKRGTFAHHMVFSFYFFTFLFTTFCLLILANRLLDIPTWLEVLIFLSFVIYLMLALRNFYKSSWIGAFFKANTISFIYLLFIVPIALFGVMFASFMLY
ncbi:DUF3667 domain-containing protein [Flavobacteriaceae bacterium TP-CH-4]|uniref:DUF3667 domain-containing protein n=1 Tax=Pelagihabitans pacificus TaxID=2696054 RepID=A0A967B0L8_9FLAO|nr:DUF3667 domain-containing protein [Pelagihabitans pacificus]NHF59936.1 DUF3667 domain-containing protein [Pelagihabitans pacificus]